MTWKLVAIVSGGQAGADRGGLQAAIDLDLGWGGWAPAGWRAEDGEIPLVYRDRMKCTSSSDYGMRTRLNVQDSDGTLIVSFAEELTGGSEFTQKTCERSDKSHLHLVLPDRGRCQVPDEVRAGILEWIEKARISVLNVAGPRESKEPGLQQAVGDALVWIFEDAAADMVDVVERVQLGVDGKPDESTRSIEIVDEWHIDGEIEGRHVVATDADEPLSADVSTVSIVDLPGLKVDSVVPPVTQFVDCYDDSGIDVRARSWANYETPICGVFDAPEEAGEP